MRHAKVLFFLVLTFFLAASCGPSMDRGDRMISIRLTGTLSDQEGQPVAETAVTLFDTGEFGVTADDGSFDFESWRVGDELEIYLDGSRFSDTVALGAIPEGTRFIVLHFRINRTTFKVDSAVAEFSVEDPAPPPQPTTAVPGATPPPSLFDEKGNTSSFGIPSGVTGNINRGSSVWDSTCQSCHAREKTGRNFQAVRRALTTVPQMRSLRITPQQVADVVAYLHRSRR
jgi:hypothetical protein